MAPDKQKTKAPSAAKRAAAPTTNKNLPILSAQMISLPDGTQVPIKIPPGMPAEQARLVVELLKTNPEAAKAAMEQAEALLKLPGFAQSYSNMQTGEVDERASAYTALKDDEEMQRIMEEVQRDGPSVLQKYWEDKELMARFSQKMRAMKISQGQEAPKPQQPPAEIKSLHDAAKAGSVDALRRLIAEGKDVNEQSDRGVRPLGVAVGFNRIAAVKVLLDSGADLALRDAKGNTVLHYAAGYGRKEVAKMLIDAGAEVEAQNDDGQKPIDVAKLNGEAHCVELRTQHSQQED